ncbi:hypothetical protein MSAN_00647100 [Mycena sanguinolenta]|uniref:Uncharacterized protein n=1 Tax=Mycena sanguinolenta TaxID=230812 RepID=A0A8H7DG47_9AGAR|nr:hypothetical protein MSAN_00647100 [Mycena sanguinolenta]
MLENDCTDDVFPLVDHLGRMSKLKIIACAARDAVHEPQHLSLPSCRMGTTTPTPPALCRMSLDPPHTLPCRDMPAPRIVHAAFYGIDLYYPGKWVSGVSSHNIHVVLSGREDGHAASNVVASASGEQVINVSIQIISKNPYFSSGTWPPPKTPHTILTGDVDRMIGPPASSSPAPAASANSPYLAPAQRQLERLAHGGIKGSRRVPQRV